MYSSVIEHLKERISSVEERIAKVRYAMSSIYAVFVIVSASGGGTHTGLHSTECDSQTEV